MELGGGELLELCSNDNLSEFKFAIEEKGYDIDSSSLWYGRRILGSSRTTTTTSMAFEERTPLMIASLYGSLSILNYIISTRKVDVSRPHGSDRATPLHCAAASGLDSSVDVVELLLASSADVNAKNVNGDTPRDLLKSSHHSKRRKLGSLLLLLRNPTMAMAALPDINVGLYGSDEFRMYSFKVKPCSRAYSHDWTECPFVHPGENARRRDPRKLQYSCVPCPEFRKGACCSKADNCEYAHGVFESWLHPAQYRTRLCKDEIGCSRKVCFFAHKTDELRPVYASTGSGIPSPTSSIDTESLWPGKASVSPPNSHLMSGRNLELEMELLSFETLRNQQQRQQLMNEYIGFNQLQSPYGFESSGSVMTSLKPAAFANRSQSFVDRGATANNRGSSAGLDISNWSSPDGKLEWGYKVENLNKLKKSASFGYRNGNYTANVAMMGPPPGITEPRVHSSTKYNPKLDDGRVHMVA